LSLFSRSHGPSVRGRVALGAKIDALHPFPTRLTAIRCCLYSVVGSEGASLKHIGIVSTRLLVDAQRRGVFRPSKTVWRHCKGLLSAPSGSATSRCLLRGEGSLSRWLCCGHDEPSRKELIAALGMLDRGQSPMKGVTRWRSRPAAEQRLRVGNSRRRVLTILGPTPKRISSVADDANPVISPYKPTFTWCRMLEDGAHQE